MSDHHVTVDLPDKSNFSRIEFCRCSKLVILWNLLDRPSDCSMGRYIRTLAYNDRIKRQIQNQRCPKAADHDMSGMWRGKCILEEDAKEERLVGSTCQVQILSKHV